MAETKRTLAAGDKQQTGGHSVRTNRAYAHDEIKTTQCARETTFRRKGLSLFDILVLYVCSTKWFKSPWLSHVGILARDFVL